MFHPNISEGGAICLDTLQSQWSPALTIEKSVISIQSLLTDANPASALNSEAGRLYVSDRAAFERKVRSYVSKYGEATALANSAGDSGSDSDDGVEIEDEEHSVSHCCRFCPF